MSTHIHPSWYARHSIEFAEKIQSTDLAVIGEIEKALNKSAIGGTETVSLPEIVKAYIDRISIRIASKFSYLFFQN